MLVDPEPAYLSLIALAAGSAAVLAILGQRLPRRGDWLGVGAGLAGFAIARWLSASSATEVGPEVLAWTGLSLVLSPGICAILSGAFLAAAAGHLAAIPLLRGRPGYGRFFPFFWAAMLAGILLSPAADVRTVAILGAPFALAAALVGCARADAKPDALAFVRLLAFLGTAWAFLAAAGGPIAALAFGAVAAGIFPLWSWVPRMARGSGPEAAVVTAAVLAPAGIAIAIRFAPAPSAWVVAAGVAGSSLAGMAAARAWDIRSIAAWTFLADTGIAFALAGLGRPVAAACLIAVSAPGRAVALAAVTAIAEGAGSAEACVIAAGSGAGRGLRLAVAAGLLAPLAPLGAGMAARGEALLAIGSAWPGGAGLVLVVAACGGHGLAAMGAGRILGAAAAGPPGEGKGGRSWLGAAIISVAAAYAVGTPSATIGSSGLVVLSGLGLLLGCLGEKRPSRWCLIRPSGPAVAVVALEGFVDRVAAPVASVAAAIAAGIDRHLIGGAFRAAAARILPRGGR
ncbi:MAG: hypothetical protein JXP34_09225 [Planctomycetes bacterium]|nr:hypothetical protein [Planctomycetota bacterium]